MLNLKEKICRYKKYPSDIKKGEKGREIDISTFQTACFFHVNGRNDSYLAHWKMFVGLSVLPKVFRASLLLIGIYVLFLLFTFSFLIKIFSTDTFHFINKSSTRTLLHRNSQSRIFYKMNKILTHEIYDYDYTRRQVRLYL